MHIPAYSPPFTHKADNRDVVSPRAGSKAQFPANITGLLCNNPSSLPTPHPHTRQAVRAVIKHALIGDESARAGQGGQQDGRWARSQPPHPKLKGVEVGGKGFGGDGQKLLLGSCTLQMGLGSELKAL